MKKSIALLLLLISLHSIYAAEYHYIFRLTLKDKGKTNYTVENPKQFLSDKSIERRKKQHIPIDETDIPISEQYIKQVQQKGALVVAKSKWMNTLAVYCNDTSLVEQLKLLPFVSQTTFVWKGLANNTTTKKDSVAYYAITDTISDNYYGRAFDNIRLNNGQYLHQGGYKGKGISIAVIDGGFRNLNKIGILDNVSIKGYKGFVYENEDVFANTNEHGLNVMSCIATNKPGMYVGTAPEADFWLLSSEDSRSEYPVEEDYWAAAVEFADSVGIDIVTTSLGYNRFDTPAISRKHSDLDGKTTLISQAANRAVLKGIFVLCSAGNSGNSEWKKITSPADAELVLTVGAIQRDSTIAKFSSLGLTSDLRIKPDVATLGVQSAVIGKEGKITYKSGTSFSTPIMAGMVASLWQENPTLTNRELLRIIKKSANKYDMPDETFGYGIPDMQKASELAKLLIAGKAQKSKKR